MRSLLLMLGIVLGTATLGGSANARIIIGVQFTTWAMLPIAAASSPRTVLAFGTRHWRFLYAE